MFEEHPLHGTETPSSENMLSLSVSYKSPLLKLKKLQSHRLHVLTIHPSLSYLSFQRIAVQFSNSNFHNSIQKTEIQSCCSRTYSSTSVSRTVLATRLHITDVRARGMVRDKDKEVVLLWLLLILVLGLRVIILLADRLPLINCRALELERVRLVKARRMWVGLRRVMQLGVLLEIPLEVIQAEPPMEPLEVIPEPLLEVILEVPLAAPPQLAPQPVIPPLHPPPPLPPGAQQVVAAEPPSRSTSFLLSTSQPPNQFLPLNPHRYGAGDSFGSANCNSASAACGWYSNPGFNAAVSQSFFGTGPGGGAGPACGLCFQLSPEGEGTKSIVVKVNNLCPASGNPLCAADKSEFCPPVFFVFSCWCWFW